MERRHLLAVIAGASLAPRWAQGQGGGRMFRIGHLDASAIADSDRLQAFFYPELAKLGFVEGKNFVLDRRSADGRLDRLPQLAAEIVAGRPDVIFAPPAPAAAAVQAATTTIPVVFCYVSDAVALGFAQSLARPGANLTGLSMNPGDLAGKRVQLLAEAVPRLKRLAIWHNPASVNDAPALRSMERAAAELALEFRSFSAPGPAELEQAAQGTGNWRADGICLTANPPFYANRLRVLHLIAQLRIPAMHSNVEFVEAGGLMSYSPNFRDVARRAAHYVGKVLQGAKPAELPIEQPTEFELIVNLNTAQSLGLAIPQPFLLRADRVIE